MSHLSSRTCLASIAALTALGVTACAVPSLAERMATYTPQQVGDFVVRDIAFGHHDDNGVPVYVAYFNGLSPSHLYIPRDKLSAFCQSKGGTFKIEAVNTVNPINGVTVPPPSRINPVEDRVAGRRSLLAAFVKASQEGAMGRYSCTGPDGTRQWTARISPGRFEPEDPTNALITNSVQMLIRTEAAPAGGNRINTGS